MPTGGVDVMVNLYEDEFRTYHGRDLSEVRHRSGAILGGAHACPTVIDTAEMRCNVSVMFETGGAAAFFAIPMSEARDDLVDLEHVWGADGRTLRERILEALTPEAKIALVEDVLLARFAAPDEYQVACVAHAAVALRDGAAVGSVTERLGVLPKRFARAFRDHVGLSPKRYARVQRLQRLLGSVASAGIGDIDWARAAVENGYYDQAHLVNDFRDLTGITPSAYRWRSADAHNHVPVAS
jgi:AraC-like DNA-binding protein